MGFREFVLVCGGFGWKCKKEGWRVGRFEVVGGMYLKNN
jgi:hypothetical protein